MRLLVLKTCALAIALGVVAFVVQASRSRAREIPEAAEPLPAESPSGAAGGVGPPPEADEGIMGPATKADPHAMRRAAESLARPAREAPAPPPPPPTAGP
jgi:hypothetical protein